jgi:hypothetical protein
MPPSTFGFSDWSQVVAMIHNHPFYKNVGTATAPVYEPNAYRHLMSTGDFATMKHLVIFENADAQFRNYVVVDNTVSEYDWYHNKHHTVYGSGGMPDAVKSDYRPHLGQ